MTDLTATARVAPDHPALPGHFPGNPIVPGVLLLSHVEAAARRAFGAGTRVAELLSVKFARPLLPGQEVIIELTPTPSGAVRFSLRHAGAAVATGSLRLAREAAPAP